MAMSQDREKTDGLVTDMRLLSRRKRRREARIKKTEVIYNESSITKSIGKTRILYETLGKEEGKENHM